MVNKSRTRGSIMSNISNTKQYAILWLATQGKTSEHISKELKISLSDVEYVISTKQSENSTEPTTAPINSKNLMITHTSGKKNNSVAIMTKEASELNDVKLKNMPSRDDNKGIFRPKSK